MKKDHCNKRSINKGKEKKDAALEDKKKLKEAIQLSNEHVWKILSYVKYLIDPDFWFSPRKRLQ